MHEMEMTQGGKGCCFLEPLTKVISQRHQSVAGARGLKAELRENK